MKFYNKSKKDNQWVLELKDATIDLNELLSQEVTNVEWLDEKVGLVLAEYTGNTNYESKAIINELGQINFANINSVESYHPEVDRIVIMVNSDALDDNQFNYYALSRDEYYFAAIRLNGEVAIRFQRNHIGSAELESDFKNNTSENNIKDIIGLYLQIEENFLILPSTCNVKSDVFDFAMTRRESHEKAIAVLNPYKPMKDIENSMQGIDELFIFIKPINLYLDYFNPQYISEEQIWEFAKKHFRLLPEPVKTWVEYFESLNF